MDVDIEQDALNTLFAEQVEYLKDRGVSQREMAEKTGVSEGLISKYAKGGRPVARQYYEKFISVYKSKLNVKYDLKLDNAHRQQSGNAAPYLSDLDVIAGKKELNGDISEYTSGLISIPEFRNVTCYVNVSGSSQYPKYIAGDIIALRQIFDFSEIQYGQMYVVVTPENRVLKKVRRAKDEKQKILLESENPKFDPYEVERAKIKAMFLVLGKITKDVL